LVGEDNPAEEDNLQEGNPAVADIRQADSRVVEGSPVVGDSLVVEDMRQVDIPAAGGDSRVAVEDSPVVGGDTLVAAAGIRAAAADDNRPVAAVRRRMSYRIWRRMCFRG
jgi:hypothetical protein